MITLSAGLMATTLRSGREDSNSQVNMFSTCVVSWCFTILSAYCCKAHAILTQEQPGNTVLCYFQDEFDLN